MKIFPIVLVMLCASAQAADPCPPHDWCGFQEQSDYARLQQQINAIRSEAEMKRSLDRIRQEESRWERVQRDMDLRWEQEKYQDDMRTFPGMPPR